jgi:hypothetical protein
LVYLVLLGVSSAAVVSVEAAVAAAARVAVAAARASLVAGGDTDTGTIEEEELDDAEAIARQLKEEENFFLMVI